MFFGRSWDDWIAQYSESHQNPFNRLCHTIGIPLIAGSIVLFIVFLLVASQLLWLPIAMFIIGWLFQFIGHYAEGKPPEFFRDWRFLFVGLRWWVAKMRGKA